MSVVEKITDTLSKVTMSSDTTKPQATETGNDTVVAAAAEGRRLYIGNLAYATTEADLRTFFEGFDIELITIPVNPRTTRPVGYAFVDLTTAEGTEKAMENLSGQTVVDRKVSVQLARKPETAEERAANGERRRENKRQQPRGARRVGTRGLALDDTTNEGASAEATTTEKATNGERPVRNRGPPADGIPSKTKVMVANLPYDMSEETLKELFAAYEPVSSMIALRPIPRYMIIKLKARGEARKGRGFGFVSLPTEELQQKAVSEMNGKDINGREIAVKVAIDSPGKEDAPLQSNGEVVENGTAKPEEVPAAA